ncbi:MAG TPA: hypothetical protein VFH47_05680, partial [Candidatus Thermoplasmatota archaeon]|nr:hypothetical protein [Candidatus Thermoplasmatota archaeon]
FQIQPDGFVAPLRSAELESRLPEAISAGRLAAEVMVAPGSSVTLPYDDVHVQAELSAAAVRIRLEGAPTGGRSVALAIADTVVAGDLAPRFLTLHDGAWTEAVFPRATGLEDALDPDNDGGQPEYWLLDGGEATHAVISIPAWTTHVVDFAATDVSSPPSVAPGLLLGVAVAAVAALALFARPRRR